MNGPIPCKPLQLMIIFYLIRHCIIAEHSINAYIPQSSAHPFCGIVLRLCFVCFWTHFVTWHFLRTSRINCKYFWYLFAKLKFITVFKFLKTWLTVVPSCIFKHSYLEFIVTWRNNVHKKTQSPFDTKILRCSTHWGAHIARATWYGNRKNISNRINCASTCVH
jgi:hypothetical protein